MDGDWYRRGGRSTASRARIETGDLGRQFDAIVDAVEPECKHLIRSWAPVVHWTLLAREDGCSERSEGEPTVFGRDEELTERLWTVASGAL